jgi:type IV pilus assembly protein PilY1
LADVAEYYFATDLRTSALGNCASSSSGSAQNVCGNIVRPVGSDKATWQHMNSFTIGLGVSGTLPYDKNYLTQTAGAYVDLTSGTLNWPVPEGADLNNGEGGNATNVDDLWHAAVNGRGQYYSALNASALSEAINGVVTSVQQVSGSGATASTSTLQLVAGDNNQVFRASYTTQLWTGDLQSFPINGTTGVIASTATWSAQAKLDAMATSARKVYFSNGSALQSFEYGNLSTAQKGYFDNLCGQTLIATQCSLLSASNKTVANTGANLVNYLRGVRTYETASVDASNNSIAALYRKRDHVLGDIINGAPVHVGKPPFSYADAGYADFVTAQATRTPVVYVGSNDGMLHAFSAATGGTGGSELWAYVPSVVMPNLYKMADSSYGSKHQYSVDGAPVMGDIKVGTDWKTIVVGGLNSGGRGYYALDITDPNNPKALWEFTDANMGLSFGNPVIAKRSDGTWIVAFASGYNNTDGDGKGHLYVLNANTGVKLLDIATSAGTNADPSGLAKINAWIESTSDNTAKRFYGGDQQGNLWRFDIDALLPPNRAAMQLAKFQVDASTPQPITTKPETVEISGRPVVVVATGRYLGSTDITDSTQQSIYAVRDTLTATGWSDVRADTTNFVRQTFTLNGPVATATAASVSNTSVDWSTKGGWWIDLPHSRERVSTNLGLQYSTLAIATAIPNGDACASGGSAWRYYLNVANGGVVTTNPAGGLWSTDGLIMGMTWVQDSNGNARIIYQKSNGDNVIETPPVATSSGSGSVHRTSWRELAD